MQDREDLTSKAATRLLKSRLRQYVYAKSFEDDKESLSDILVVEKSIETAAERSWTQILSLWDEALGNDGAAPVKLDAVIYGALADAVEQVLSLDLLSHEHARDRIAEFVKDFRPTMIWQMPVRK
jgi:hypothetical protein